MQNHENASKRSVEDIISFTPYNTEETISIVEGMENESFPYTKISLDFRDVPEYLNKKLFDAIAKSKLTLLAIKNYSEFDDSDENFIAKIIQNSTTLTQLSLDNVEITVDCMKGLGEALACNKTLTSLQFDWNALEDGGVIAIAKALETNEALKKLDINCQCFAYESDKVNKNEVGDDGAMALANLLLINSTLTSLCLRGANITNKGAEALASALEHNHTLVELDLSENNDITDNSILKQIEGSLERNRKLAEVVNTALEAFDAMISSPNNDTMELSTAIDNLVELRDTHPGARDVIGSLVIKFVQYGMIETALQLFAHCADNKLAAEALVHPLFVDERLCSNGLSLKDKGLLIWRLGKNLLLDENKSILRWAFCAATTGTSLPPVALDSLNVNELITEMERLEKENKLPDLQALLGRAINCLTPMGMSHPEPLSLQPATASSTTTAELPQAEENSTAVQQEPGQQGFSEQITHKCWKQERRVMQKIM